MALSPRPVEVATLTVFMNLDAGYADHPTYHERRGCHGAVSPVSLEEAADREARPCGHCSHSFDYIGE